MKQLTVAVSLVAMLAMTGSAFAGTEYHVYKKKGTSKCEITTRTPDKFRKAKGSSWKFIGKDSTRSGAKKIFKSNGCTK